ncbi:MAG TPA: DUF6515 family protein [Steroidobacteraceae bacterium]|jgi:hypothetical protein
MTTQTISNPRKSHKRTALPLVALLAAALLPLAASAGQGLSAKRYGHERDDGPRDSRGYVLDNRYNHNHYYPPRGYAVGALPRGYVTVNYRGGPYYFHQGVFYRPLGGHYVVVRPAVGLFVPVLPPFYTTLWFGGFPYYYADSVYYRWYAGRGYEVVDPPGGPNANQQPPPAAAAAQSDLFIYPKNGQSEEQQGRDRYECHSWASGQSGFDPTQPSGGVAEAQASAKRADYQRAMQACLEARGYSVK